MGDMTSTNRNSLNPPDHTLSALESRVDELRFQLVTFPPDLLAVRTGASYLALGQNRGEFHLELMGASIIVTYPEFNAINVSTNTSLPVYKHTLVLYYFLKNDGAQEAGIWVSFAELPEGMIYTSAFQGYTGDKLARTFALDSAGFCTACKKASGVSANFGDASYRFQIFPRMNLLVVYHLGEDYFPSTCKLLFDGNAGHQFPTEACAIIGSLLAQKILKCADKKL